MRMLINTKIATSQKPIAYIILFFLLNLFSYNLLLAFISVQVHGDSSPTIISVWRENPVTIDSLITSDNEYLETSGTFFDIFTQGAETLTCEVWLLAVNDETYLYLLVNIAFPIELVNDTDAFSFTYLWGDIDPQTGDYQYVDFNKLGIGVGNTEDYTWDSNTDSFILDNEFLPSGQNNVEGVGSFDDEGLWFEFRKPLNSNDGCDWNFGLGETYGLGNDSLYFGFYSTSLNESFLASVSLTIANSPIPPQQSGDGKITLDWSIKVIGGILSICGAAFGVYTKMTSSKREKKKKQVLYDELLEQIDEIYSQFKSNAHKCEIELNKIKKQIINEFKEGTIEPDKFTSLDNKIDEYLNMIRKNRGSEDSRIKREN